MDQNLSVARDKKKKKEKKAKYLTLIWVDFLGGSF